MAKFFRNKYKIDVTLKTLHFIRQTTRYQKPSNKCYICQRKFEEMPRWHYFKKTSDHIVPVAYIKRGFKIDRIIRNRKEACASCNEMRGNAGHCIGALAAVKSIKYGVQDFLLARERYKKQHGYFPEIIELAKQYPEFFQHSRIKGVQNETN